MQRSLAKKQQPIPLYANGEAWLADKKNWKTLAKKPFEHTPLAYLKSILLQDIASGYPIKVSVGTDSQQWGDTLKFATAIIVHKEGRGSRGLYTKWQTGELSLYQKLLLETQSSIYCAWGIGTLVNSLGLEVEIHLDINPKDTEKSYVAMKECLGYVFGMGYVSILKPDATTTRCADHLLKTGEGYLPSDN